MGVLQTWARNLVYHPHIHFLIPGGGISMDGKRWIWAKPDFFVHVKPLSILIRTKFKQALKDAGLFQDVPANVWRQK
ncbi:transposase [candidate division KSB1 bacterium]|nr:transposase [candidate division KSB1 bacterium]